VVPILAGKLAKGSLQRGVAPKSSAKKNGVDHNDIQNMIYSKFHHQLDIIMGYSRKTFYTIIGLPTAALVAEHPDTIRRSKRRPPVTSRIADSLSRLDRFECMVPVMSLNASRDTPANSPRKNLAREPIRPATSPV